jgi:acyl carrier protein
MTAMTSADVLAKLQPIFQDVFDMPELALKPELSASDIEEWDSLNHVRIISAAEDLFSVRFSAQEIEDLTCVGDFAQLIAGKLAAS